MRKNVKVKSVPLVKMVRERLTSPSPE
jgi:hypothetical protein